MTASAKEYHEKTSYDRYDMRGHSPDVYDQPSVFKAYVGAETVPLPPETAWPQEKLSDLAGAEVEPDASGEFALERLARIVALTHALTAKARYGGADFYFRSVASAGALYPFELYLAAQDMPGLGAGLYHHTVGLNALTRVRSGNALPLIADAVRFGDGPPPVLIFLLTAIYFRSSWKYRDRAYRYHLLDTGHLLENLALALTCDRVPFKLFYDFDDRLLNELLAIDPDKEVCLAVAAVSGKAQHSETAPKLSSPIEGAPAASRVAGREADYPAIRAIHESSSKVVPIAASAPPILSELGVRLTEPHQVAAPTRWPEVMSYAEAVVKRRSMRNFVPDELPADCFAAFLAMVCAEPLSRSDADAVADASVAVGFLAERVQGLEPGFYLLNRENRTISLVRRGTFSDDTAHTCLGQGWLANCAIHFLFSSNLDLLETTWGPRGYRYSMLTAGRLGQRLYLSATSMRIGCCGIGAFYDGEARQLLGLNENSSLLYLVAAGPVRKWTAG